MSNNTILGTKPFSDFMNVAEVALKIMQGKPPIEEQWADWLDDEARDVEHKWKRMNTKLRNKWLARIKKMADKEDMSQEVLDKILSQYGLLKFDNEKVWDEAQKIKPKWKKMSTAQRTQWVDKMHVIAVKARTSDADVQSILDDAKLKIKEEVEATRMPMEAPFVLTEALKPVDKSVIDAFYYKKERVAGELLSTNGRSLEKHGMGGQTIAAWLKGKIAITAVSDVKSTEAILKYMKKSIPKGMFDPKSYKKFFGEDVELDEIAPWKKGKYKVTDGKTGKVLGTFKSGEKAQKYVDKIWDEGDYDSLTVELGEEVVYTRGVEITESTTTDKKNTFGMAPFKDLKNVADAALKIMTRQPQEVKEEEEEKEEVTKEDQPQTLTEQIV